MDETIAEIISCKACSSNDLSDTKMCRDGDDVTNCNGCKRNLTKRNQSMDFDKDVEIGVEIGTKYNEIKTDSDSNGSNDDNSSTEDDYDSYSDDSNDEDINDDDDSNDEDSNDDDSNDDISIGKKMINASVVTLFLKELSKKTNIQFGSFEKLSGSSIVILFILNNYKTTVTSKSTIVSIISQLRFIKGNPIGIISALSSLRSSNLELFKEAFLLGTDKNRISRKIIEVFVLIVKTIVVNIMKKLINPVKNIRLENVLANFGVSLFDAIIMTSTNNPSIVKVNRSNIITSLLNLSGVKPHKLKRIGRVMVKNPGESLSLLLTELNTGPHATLKAVEVFKVIRTITYQYNNYVHISRCKTLLKLDENKNRECLELVLNNILNLDLTKVTIDDGIEIFIRMSKLTNSWDIREILNVTSSEKKR